MARYEFKLPDIGEGIAEAEIVAWHVKVGDKVEEDQQLADMMTDKATVEMESPVAGKVLEVAGEVGDMIAIGSVLVVIETEGEAAAASRRADAPTAWPRCPRRSSDGRRRPRTSSADERRATRRAPPGRGRRSTPTVAKANRRAARAIAGRGDRRRVRRRPAPRSASTRSPIRRHGKAILASPAVRARARDLGIDLAQVKISGRPRPPRRSRRLSALQRRQRLARRAAPRRQDEEVKVVGLRRKIAENMQEAKRRIPHFTYGRGMSTSPRSSRPGR